MSTHLAERFEIAAASVAGGAHRSAAKGSQDGYSLLCEQDRIIAVVSDGCGSSPYSQVGATLGAQLWAQALRDELRDGGPVDIAALLTARERVAVVLGELADRMPGARADVVRDYFLFTAIGAVVESSRTAVFAVGDGLIGINGSFVTLDAGIDNAPAYVGYELCDETRGLGDLQFVAIRPTIEIQSLVLATDGASVLLDGGVTDDLETLTDDEQVYANRDQLRRRLEELAAEQTAIDWDKQRVVRRGGVLRDDTTIVAIRALTASQPGGQA